MFAKLYEQTLKSAQKNNAPALMLFELVKSRKDHMGTKDCCLMGLREEMGGASSKELPRALFIGGDMEVYGSRIGVVEVIWGVVVVAADWSKKGRMWLHLRPRKGYSSCISYLGRLSDTVFEDTSLPETLMNDQPNLVDDIAEEDDVLCPPKSTTKGRKRKGREKGGKELANKKRNKCRLCKEVGHTRPTCPNKENINVMQVVSSSSNVSRKKLSPKDFGLNPIFNVKY
ncbi:protein FAR1-related sequence 11 [Tanacetum coccineum]